MNERIFTREEIEEQRRMIIDILESGDGERIRKLRLVKNDPELHPQIRELIQTCELMLLMAFEAERR